MARAELDVSTGRAGRGVRVSIRGLSKSYGALHVLHELDLDLAPGGFVAIVGRSGCGKTTLLRQVAGLESADEGRIDIGGDERLYPHDTCVVFQEARLLPWKTVLGNVGLGISGDWRPAARAALAEVGLAERAEDWPAVLSGGQRQRVSLARALIHAPRVLLLDEPLGALDALTRIEMQDLVERLWLQQGFTALLVTHDVTEAVALADRVVLIEDGAVAFDLPIDLPRPRERGSAVFAAMVERVLRRVVGRIDGATP